MGSAATIARYKQELRGASLRVTSGRVAVLQALEDVPHSTADTVFGLISGDLPGTSPQAVYMVLNDLTRVGLIRRFEPAGSAALYERRVGDNHHHLVCESCAAVQDVDCVVGRAPCLTPGGDVGFRVREAEVTFWGLCARCQGQEQSVDPVLDVPRPHLAEQGDPAGSRPQDASDARHLGRDDSA